MTQTWNDSRSPRFPATSAARAPAGAARHRRTRRGGWRLLVLLVAALTLAALTLAAAPLARSDGSRVLAPAPSGRWRAPLDGSLRVLAPFAPPAQRWQAGHRGVDLAATSGADVRAAGAGVVVYAGQLAGRGVVSVSHGVLRTTYEPLDVTVTRGQRVAAGATLGTVAAGLHSARREGLHWGLRRGSEDYLDPMLLLARGRLRLLPVREVDRAWLRANAG